MQDQLNEQQTWIKQQAIPLTTTDPDEPLDDLLPLQHLLGDASLVGLGEATHGSHEFFSMKHRLLKFLVEKMGFTMFAMEGSWSAGEKINHYVLTGEGSAQDVLQQFYFWTWSTQEVLDLITWVRAYNADPRHRQKIMFAGFDCQNIQANTYDAVIHYVQTVDQENAPTVKAWYQDVRPQPRENMRQYTSNYSRLPQATRQGYVERAQQVFDHLRHHQTTYMARSSSQAYEQALQEARVIVQNAQLLSGRPDLTSMKFFQDEDRQRDISRNMSNQRDAFMAENIAWLHEHADGGAKIVLWAHNGHVQTAADTRPEYAAWIRMGIHLRERYQAQYVSIGMSFYEGAFNARGVDNDDHVTDVQPFHIQAIQESYQALFGSIGLPLYLLDFRHIPEGPVKAWMGGPHPFFALGAVYSTTADELRFFYNFLDVLQSFDLVIHIQQVTASQYIPISQL